VSICNLASRHYLAFPVDPILYAENRIARTTRAMTKRMIVDIHE
jgi:hypothetical protein